MQVLFSVFKDTRKANTSSSLPRIKERPKCSKALVGDLRCLFDETEGIQPLQLGAQIIAEFVPRRIEMRFECIKNIVEPNP